MPSKTLLSAGVLGLCAIALFSYIIQTNSSTTKQEIPTILTVKQSLNYPPKKTVDGPKDIKFVNKELALEVLNQIDVFKPVDDSYFKIDYGSNPRYNEALLGLKINDDYCQQHREYFVENSDTLINEMNFIMGTFPGSVARELVVPFIGNDIMPEVYGAMPKELRKSFTYDQRIDANIFFSEAYSFGLVRHIGKHVGCISQELPYIPGTGTLFKKSHSHTALKKYLANVNSNGKQCLAENTLFLRNWLLPNKQECEDFFRIFNSPEYERLKKERRIVFVGKVPEYAHQGEGVRPINEDEEGKLRKAYLNGEKCGNKTFNFIIQDYVHNPLLINGKKCEIRAYMLVASINPLIAYYHDGFMKVNLLKYDVNSDDDKVLLTNIHLNNDIYVAARNGSLFEGMDEDALKEAQRMNYSRVLTYLTESGLVSDPNWLDNHLRPQTKKLFIHLLRMSQHTFLKRSSLYDFFGVDFMIDENLDLWFLEANAGPELQGFPPGIQNSMIDMIRSEFEIIFGLLRSRVKRIVNYVNKLIEEKKVYQNEQGQAVIQDVDARRREFEEVIKNRFEKEYEPKAGNTWSLIIDENYNDSRRYQGLLNDDCI